MKEFPPIKGIKLTDNVINKLKNHFKWSSFSTGENNISVTKSGGIYYTGVKQKSKAVTFEITRSGVYLMVSLFEYPHGIIFHVHVYYPQVGKINSDSIIKLYNEVKNLLDSGDKTMSKKQVQEKVNRKDALRIYAYQKLLEKKLSIKMTNKIANILYEASEDQLKHYIMSQKISKNILREHISNEVDLNETFSDFLTLEFIKEDFLKGAMIGAAVGGLTGALTQYFSKCIKHCDSNHVSTKAISGAIGGAIGGAGRKGNKEISGSLVAAAGAMGSHHLTNLLFNIQRSACMIQCKINYYTMKMKRSDNPEDKKKYQEKVKKWNIKKQDFMIDIKNKIQKHQRSNNVFKSEEINSINTAVQKGFSTHTY